MNITCVIVDDEKLARDLLQEYLQQIPNIQIVGEASKGKDAVELIDKVKPDLVFLDVQMPGMTGFDVLEEINHDPFVIFCTAYDQYALKAFEKNAVDYVLKPLDQERFRLAVDRAAVNADECFRVEDLFQLSNTRRAYELIVFGSEYGVVA